MGVNRLALSTNVELARRSIAEMHEADAAAADGRLLDQLQHGWNSAAAYDDLTARGGKLVDCGEFGFDL